VLLVKALHFSARTLQCGYATMEGKVMSAETDQLIDRVSRKIRKLGSRIDNIVEDMVGRTIIEQFQRYEYDIFEIRRNIEFGKGTAYAGEIDVLLDDGDIAILICVKTNLKNDDVLEHIKQMENYRKLKNSKSEGKKRYIGAVAGAVVADNVVKFAQRKGMYVIAQTGETFHIIPPPEGFKAKEW
jgi:hypothetical protein